MTQEVALRAWRPLLSLLASGMVSGTLEWDTSISALPFAYIVSMSTAYLGFDSTKIPVCSSGLSQIRTGSTASQRYSDASLRQSLIAPSCLYHLRDPRQGSAQVHADSLSGHLDGPARLSHRPTILSSDLPVRSHVLARNTVGVQSCWRSPPAR